MKTSVAIVSVLGIFLVGVLVGAVGMHLHGSHTLPWHPGAALHSQASTYGAPPFLRGLEDALHLSRAQITELHEILAASRHEADTIRHEVAPRVHEHLEATHQRLLRILTPEQRAQLLELHTPYWRDEVAGDDPAARAHDDPAAHDHAESDSTEQH